MSQGDGMPIQLNPIPNTFSEIVTIAILPSSLADNRQSYAPNFLSTQPNPPIKIPR